LIKKSQEKFWGKSENIFGKVFKIFFGGRGDLEGFFLGKISGNFFGRKVRGEKFCRRAGDFRGEDTIFLGKFLGKNLENFSVGKVLKKIPRGAGEKNFGDFGIF
jgi:hypothetical protein